jgi:hypothetical protein
MLHSVLEEDEQCVPANGLRRCDGGHEMSDFTDRALGLVMDRHGPGIAMRPPGPSGCQHPREPLRAAAAPNAASMARPYSGLETQAPDRANKDEALFSAAAGTIQHTPQLGCLGVCFREHGNDLVQLVRDTLQCLLVRFRGHRNTRKLDDSHSADDIIHAMISTATGSGCSPQGVFEVRQDLRPPVPTAMHYEPLRPSTLFSSLGAEDAGHIEGRQGRTVSSMPAASQRSIPTARTPHGIIKPTSRV